MMMTRSRLAALLVFVLAACVSAAADIPRPNSNGGPRPQPSPSAEAHMRIEPYGSEQEARLVIPRSVLRELGGETNDGTPAPSTGLFGGAGPGGAQTVMAGLFLSLGVVLGGVWLVRSRRVGAGRPRAALGALALLVLGASGGVAYANIAPPRVARPLNWNILVAEAKRNGAAGQVRVEVIEEGDQITLLLPKSQ